MSEVAISALTSLGAAPATGDLLVLVDISNPAQSPGGSTMKMTVGNLFTAPTFTGTTTIAAIAALNVLAGGTIAGSLATSAVTAATLVISNTGVELLTLTNTAGVAGVLQLAQYGRTGVISGYLGMSAADDLIFQVPNGNVALTIARLTGLVTVGFDFNISTATTQVLQMGAVATLTRTAATGALAITTGSNGNISLTPGGTGITIIAGNTVVGSMTPPVTTARGICISNGVAPGATPSGGGVLYVSAGALVYIGSSGTTTGLAPA